MDEDAILSRYWWGEGVTVSLARPRRVPRHWAAVVALLLGPATSREDIDRYSKEFAMFPIWMTVVARFDIWGPAPIAIELVFGGPI